MAGSGECVRTVRVRLTFQDGVTDTLPLRSIVKCVCRKQNTFTRHRPNEYNYPNVNVKRENYMDWDDYFMATAFLAAKRSKDPCTQVGACIVNDENIIVGVGYNGFPQGCDDNVFPWAKTSASPLENKYFYVCHAEMNAILNRNATNTKGCRMYVALFPCNECAKFIIQSGIKEVIYMSNKNFPKPETIAARRMFDAARVTYRQLIPKQKKIVIDFNEINWNIMSQLPPSPMKPVRDETN